MKNVLISIKPYWVFLIIAKTMGWAIDKQKTIEVRKTFPQDDEWNKVVKIYCTKDKKSFNFIPKEYQPFMEKFLGKVIGEFVCNQIDDITIISTPMMEYIQANGKASMTINSDACLDIDELSEYANGKTLYGWHISDLKIYDEPKELEAFTIFCDANKKRCANCKHYLFDNDDLNGYRRWCDVCHRKPLTRPPQSWCYVALYDYCNKGELK